MSRQRAWQERKRVDGLCVTCGKRKNREGLRECLVCGKKQAERCLARYHANRTRRFVESH